MTNQSDSNQLTYGKGILLFKQGDPGGDLIFIQAGKVEVFKVVNGKDITLSTLGPGDILGGVSCFNALPFRTASAKCIEDTVVKVVKKSKFQKLIDEVPGWLKALIKDFTIRIVKADERAIKLNQELERLNDLVLSTLKVSEQFVNLFMEIAPNHIEVIEDQQVFSPDKVLNRVSQILKYDLEFITSIYACLSKHGFGSKFLLKFNESYYMDIQGISDFREYSSRMNDQIFNRILRKKEFIKQIDLNFLSTILKYAMNSVGEEEIFQEDIEKTKKNYKELYDNPPFEYISIEKSRELQLVNLENTENEILLSFEPKKLMFDIMTLRCISRFQNQKSPMQINLEENQ